jgi:hypothetical protein
MFSLLTYCVKDKPKLFALPSILYVFLKIFFGTNAC